jgi:hypothetical protein
MRQYHCNELFESKQLFHLGIAHNNIMIINDSFRVIRMKPQLGALTCYCHSDNSRGVFYALKITNYTPREDF